MRQPEPFYRESGHGPTVICLHSNASHSGQWRGLMDLLAPRFHAVAVDSWGSGKTADWPSDRTITLADEVALIEPLLARAGSPVFLVGHSYGAAVALKAALLQPGRFAGLVLYEPTLFALVDRRTPADVDGIRHAVERAAACLDAGDGDGAARAFIDFWMGAGAWEHMPADRKPAMAQSVRNVRRWAHALMTEPATLEEIAALRTPVAVLTGARSPRSSQSVAELLRAHLPNVQSHVFAKLGHMAPVTDPEQVNPVIVRLLDAMA